VDTEQNENDVGEEEDSIKIRLFFFSDSKKLCN